MSFLSAAEFSRLAGVTQMAISKALNPKDGKEPRLDYYKGSKKIDTDSVKARAFLDNINPNRGGAKAVAPISLSSPSATASEGLTQALTRTQENQAKKLAEEAELKKQQRIEKELKNAVRRGELIELAAVNQMIMVWFDRWLQSNKRGFNASFDDFLRAAFLIFENDRNANSKNFKPHPVTRPELKRKWSNLFESWADDGKGKSINRLDEIQIEQAKT